MTSGRREILSLYKRMLKESAKFPSYNFRNYALRRVQDGFKENKSETDPQKVTLLVKEAQKNFEIIQRQVILGSLYKDSLPHLIDSTSYKP